MKFILISLSLAVAFAGCTKSGLVKEDEAMLLGKITKEELHAGFPVFLKNETQYAPDIKKVDSLRTMTHKIDVVLFLGTWCSDSKTEAPKFLKLYNQLHSNLLSLKIYGVDREKTEPGGLAKEHNIEYVPTVIFFRDGVEIGRIVEYPEESMEADFLRILQKNKLI